MFCFSLDPDPNFITGLQMHPFFSACCDYILYNGDYYVRETNLYSHTDTKNTAVIKFDTG
jgi:hypothetical protein